MDNSQQFDFGCLEVIDDDQSYSEVRDEDTYNQSSYLPYYDDDGYTAPMSSPASSFSHNNGQYHQESYMNETDYDHHENQPPSNFHNNHNNGNGRRHHRLPRNQIYFQRNRYLRQQQTLPSSTSNYYYRNHNRNEWNTNESRYDENHSEIDWTRPPSNNEVPNWTAPPNEVYVNDLSTPPLPSSRNNENYRNERFRHTDRERRRSILKYYQCPFRNEDRCIHESNPARCMFGHEENSELKEIPPYVCIYALLNSCSNMTNDLRCQDGFHLSLEQLVDSNTFEQDNAEQIQRFYDSKDGNLDCVICLDKVTRKCLPRNRRFAILENCSHIFCMRCIQEWRKTSINCPMCRVESRRYVCQNKFITDINFKRRLFNSRHVRMDPLPESQPADSFPVNIESLVMLDNDGNLIYLADEWDDDSEEDWQNLHMPFRFGTNYRDTHYNVYISDSNLDI